MALSLLAQALLIKRRTFAKPSAHQLQPLSIPPASNTSLTIPPPLNMPPTCSPHISKKVVVVVVVAAVDAATMVVAVVEVAVGGGGAAPFVAAPAIVQPNQGVKRQLTNQQELADWYAIAPYPNLRMCWSYLNKTGVCKGSTICQRKDKQPHFFPKGYDQKLYMAWLKKKPT